MGTSSKDFFLEAGPFRVAARQYGTLSQASGKKVLALHGWLDNLASFDPIAPSLTHWELVAIDLIGHGHSDHRPKGSAYHFLDCVPFLSDVADSLGWDRFSILGHSMGGAMATLFAGTFPDRIESLFLIESLAPFSREAEEVPLYLAKHVQQLKELRQKKLPIYESKELAAKARKQAGDLSLESARRLAERGLKEVTGGFTWRSDPVLRIESPMRMTEAQVRAFLRRIDCPVTLVEAESGMKWNPTLIEERKREIKQLRIETLPGGHHIHMESPEKVAAYFSTT